MIARFFRFIENQRSKEASSQYQTQAQVKAAARAPLANTFDAVGCRLCAMSQEQFRDYLRRHAEIWHF